MTDEGGGGLVDCDDEVGQCVHQKGRDGRPQPVPWLEVDRVDQGKLEPRGTP
jgi:hypothetical protein